MTIKIKANTNNKSGKQKPPQILKLYQKGSGLKKNKKLEQIKNTKLKTKKKSKNTTGLQFPFQIQKKGH